MGDESLYKRLADKDWRDSVDLRLVSLTSAQKQADDDLDKQENRIEGCEHLLDGDPLDKDDFGLKGDVSELWKAHNKLNAIMAPDNLGEGGWDNRLKAVEYELGIKRNRRKGRWKIITLVWLAVISTIGFLISNLDKVEHLVTIAGNTFSTRSSQTKDKKSSKKNSTQSTRKSGPVLKVKPPKPLPALTSEEAIDGATKEGMSEGRSSDGGDVE